MSWPQNPIPASERRPQRPGPAFCANPIFVHRPVLSHWKSCGKCLSCLTRRERKERERKGRDPRRELTK